MSQGQPNLNFPISGSSKVISIFSGDAAAADEGSYFTSTLVATASTSTACTTVALANTNPSFAIYNGQQAGGYNIYMRYIKVKTTAVGGSNTSKNYSMAMDNITVKLTSTGTALSAPTNINSGSSVLSKASLYAGVLLAAGGSSNVRLVGDGTMSSAVEVALDEWIFDFGAPVMGKNMTYGTATLISQRTVPCSPIVIAPGWWLTLGFWGASQAAAASTYGWEVGFIERPSGQ